MSDETDRQLRQIRHENRKQAAALLFAANAAVGATIVQWLLRDPMEPLAVRLFALAAAAAHGVGILFAARLPLTLLEQQFNDAKSGTPENPLAAAPLRTLRQCIWSFAAGLFLLGVGLLVRECLAG